MLLTTRRPEKRQRLLNGMGDLSWLQPPCVLADACHWRRLEAETLAIVGSAVTAAVLTPTVESVGMSPRTPGIRLPVAGCP